MISYLRFEDKTFRIQPIRVLSSFGRSAIAIVAQDDCGGKGTSNCGLYVTLEGP
jgi:hypothetical protein